MPSACLILKVHEPYRLRHYSFFDIGELSSYEDDAGAFAHLDKIANQCYLPATRVLLKQIKEYKGDFRVALLLSGVLIDQMERFNTDLLSQFKQLADTGCVEFICEPYYRSLSFLFSKPEFREQVKLHRAILTSLFEQVPSTFHYHAVSYNNDIALEADALGFKTILAAGKGPVIENRSLHRIYQPVPAPSTTLLLEAPILADNLARFSRATSPSKRPLTAPLFVNRLAHKQGEVITLSANLKAFEEHPLGEPGALEFLSQLPGAWLASGGRFQTPAQVAKTHQPCGTISIPGFTSCEEAESDDTECMGNEMQKDAVHGLYQLEPGIKAHANPELLLNWRHLQVSDHFSFMNMNQLKEAYNSSDSDPYHSPYDAYINFMNILTDFSERLLPR